MNPKARRAARRARELTNLLLKLYDPLKRSEARAERDWQRRKYMYYSGRSVR